MACQVPLETSHFNRDTYHIHTHIDTHVYSLALAGSGTLKDLWAKRKKLFVVSYTHYLAPICVLTHMPCE